MSISMGHWALLRFFIGICGPLSGPLDFRLSDASKSQLPSSLTYEAANISYVSL